MPAPDLILHIGLAKCGSSTLQRSVFRHEEGYIGTAAGLGKTPNFAKLLQHCTPFVGRQRLNKRGLRRWAEEVLDFQERHWPGIDRLILSNEVLSSANRFSDQPILGVISELQANQWPGKIRIVLVLRNQVGRIASSYAQSSAVNPNAGQADFERYVDQIMRNRRNRRLFDYSTYVERLRGVVGRAQLCVLLIEETGSLEFWSKLSDFCRLRRLDPEAMVQAAGDRKNRRSISEREWAISPFDPDKAARDKVDQWLNLLWSRRLMARSRDRVRMYAAEFLAKRSVQSELRSQGNERDDWISMTPTVRQLIEDQCGSFNKKLGQQLERNFDDLGYFVSD